MVEQQLEGIGMTSRRTRERLIARLRAEGIRDQRVLDRIFELPRHLFVEEGFADRAYEDMPLPIGHRQTISQPYIVARMTELLLQTPDLNTVLEVGTGSGYQSAVLSPFVRRIYTTERIGALIPQAQERLEMLSKMKLMSRRNVHIRHTDGGMGLPEYAPYDGIIVTAAPSRIPDALIEQLRVGGVLLAPVGGSERQVMVKITRTERGYEQQTLEPVIFVPLLNGLTE